MTKQEKVFSMLQYIKQEIKIDNINRSDYRVGENIDPKDMWQEQCEGKTREEIHELGFGLVAEWLTTKNKQQKLSLEDTRQECQRLLTKYRNKGDK